MNRQSNTYTIIYSVIMVIVVGVVLSVVYQALRPAQLDNIANDKRKQILSAVFVTPKDGENIGELYQQTIVRSFMVNSSGDSIASSINPFDVDIAAEVKKSDQDRLLPVFVAKTDNGEKYIIPVYGAGLWGPIWGYVSFNNTGNTIYGAYFAHQGETPGLGAEIEKSDFQNQFKNKCVFGSTGKFESVAVVKRGMESNDKVWVHAISGGTITSQGVQAMLHNSLKPYSNFLLNLNMDK